MNVRDPLPPPTPADSARALLVLAQAAHDVGNSRMAEFYRQAADQLVAHGDKPAVVATVLAMKVPS